ncbi:MAG: 50S ribosomal protein L35 [Patescibacteria group bacterium]
MKTSKSISKRIRITKNGKVMRRAMALGHSRVNKSSSQMKRKKLSRGLVNSKELIKKYF